MLPEPVLLHVNFYRPDREKRLVRHCPTCRQRRRMYASHQEWYGWRMTCCHCGESWEDGEMLPRPFERGWRRRRASVARRKWAAAAAAALALLLTACQSPTQRHAHELASQCATDREWLSNEAIHAKCQALGEAMNGGEGCSFPCRVDEAKVREAAEELEAAAKAEGVGR